MILPKVGTVERVVLDKLLTSESGVSFFDFDPVLGITEEILAAVVERLRHGIFESDCDDEIIFDA